MNCLLFNAHIRRQEHNHREGAGNCMQKTAMPLEREKRSEVPISSMKKPTTSQTWGTYELIKMYERNR